MIVVYIGICVAVIVVAIKYLSDRKSIRQLLEIADCGQSAFKSICTPNKIFTDADLAKFRSTYDISKDVERMLNKRFVFVNNQDRDGLQQYLDFIGNLKNIQYENNRCMELLLQAEKENEEINERLFSYKEYCGFLKFTTYMKSKSDFFKELRQCIKNNDSLTLSESCKNVLSLSGNSNEFRREYNQLFIKKEEEARKKFFETILAYPLDKQQRHAIICNEDNTLVISSAGSGKTSTIIGKAKYLMDVLGVDPSKILIVTFTRKAAIELSERIDNEKVECCTFHGLAYRIISEVRGTKPSICEASVLLNVFKKLIATDEEFIKAVSLYILHQQSLMKVEHEYNDSVSYFAERKKYGIQAIYPDMYGNIIYTRSEEEKRICTYLTEFGIDFTYEELYEKPTQTPEYRQYRPDFSIYYTITVTDSSNCRKDIRKRIYLEHFAVDEHGQVPNWFGEGKKGGWREANKKYLDGMAWKRHIHESNRTRLIETYSADFHAKRLLKRLKEQLIAEGVPIRPRTPKELYEMAVERHPKLENSVFTLFESFISLLKASCQHPNEFLEKAQKNCDNRTLSIVSKIIVPLMDGYVSALQANKEIDFTDAVLIATEYCNEGLWKDYEYILVDEFQDISADRYRFIQSLRSKDNITRLFCVGDDWQSIYRFAGSDMKLFYKFEDYFGFTEYCKIEHTYRFHNPALNISSEFIQKNPEQKAKEVISNARPMPVYDNLSANTEMYECVFDGQTFSFPINARKDIELWAKNNRTDLTFHSCGQIGQKQNGMRLMLENIVRNTSLDYSILIIGRYTNDCLTIGGKSSNNGKLTVTVDGRNIPFLTVHSSKGLEADVVILVNCNEGIYGFPSLIEDDPVLRYVLSDADTYEYAEERRLFYVAITRARKHTYVLYNEGKASPFVREITKELNKGEYLCPLCQQGHIIKYKEGQAKNGNKFSVYYCSNKEAGCDYNERVFGDEKPEFVRFNELLEKRSKIGFVGNKTYSADILNSLRKIRNA